MKIDLSHQRATIGNDLLVRVAASDGHLLVSVITRYDGFVLANDLLNPPLVNYDRSFRQVGSAAPGMEHDLVATATEENGAVGSSGSRWSDPV